MKKPGVLLGVVLIAFALTCFLVSNLRDNSSTGSSSPSRSTENAIQHQGDATLSNIVRTGSTDASATPVAGPTRPPKIDEKNPPEVQHFGKTQPVKGDASTQAGYVLEALKSKQNPERLSAMFPAKPFDKAAFDANPRPYLDSTEPGRVFQTAQPKDGVPVLTAASDRMVRIKQGESVKLSVKGAPKSPISFTSFDLGAFAESKLNSVTVQADQNGVATVTFIATSGTLNDANVLAGSPESSGQVKFVVDIAGAAGPQRAPAATKEK